MIRFLFLLVLLLGPAASVAQPPAPPAPLTTADIAARLHATGRVELAGGQLVIERYDFDRHGAHVEAVIVRPAAAGTHPGLLLIPGHTRTAIDMLPASVRFARAGFATLAVSQPGYGGSTGPADFAGPRTFAALRDAAERFAREPYVDAAHMGIYGYSRGALAAAELAARTDLFRAAVLGGGIYDFRAAYDQVSLAGIRENMAAEAGLSEQAVRFRSPIRDMAGLDGPVLIVHGADDANAPLAQARALDARLTALGREHELLILPGRDHGLPVADIIGPATAFFIRHLVERR
jgi:dipeptidyl aminopeptidase/acylaminoacyl peptidase